MLGDAIDVVKPGKSEVHYHGRGSVRLLVWVAAVALLPHVWFILCLHCSAGLLVFLPQMFELHHSPGVGRYHKLVARVEVHPQRLEMKDGLC